MIDNIEKLIEAIKDERAKAYEKAITFQEWKCIEASASEVGMMMAFDRCVDMLTFLLNTEKEKQQ